MKKLDVILLTLALAGGAHAAAQKAAPKTASASKDPETQFIDCLQDKLQSKDALLSDYAILMATKYQAILEDPSMSGGKRADAVHALLESCRAKHERIHDGLVKLPEKDVPRLLDGGDRASLERAIDLGFEKLNKLSPGDRVPFGGRFEVHVKDLSETLHLLRNVVGRCGGDKEKLAHLLADEFDVYQSRGNFGNYEVLYTAYAFPMFKASKTKHGAYQYPVYRHPAGRFAKLPRAQIYDGAIAGKGLEIAYLTSPLEAFLIEVQGSGGVELEEGGYILLRYAGGNGHPYRSLGKMLINDGKIKAWNVSIGAITQYFEEHPDEMRGYLEQCQSFVFFKDTDTDSRPGDPELVGERCIASDKRYFSRGAVAFVETALPQSPDSGKKGWMPYKRLVVDLDTGGAIKGAGHIDLYCGNTREGYRLAGATRHPGRLFYLLKKGKKLLE